MMANHGEFLKFLTQFKASLAEEKDHHKYLLYRLDFNMYYQVKAMNEVEEKKKRTDKRGGAGGQGFDDMNDDYGDEGEDDDEDEDDEDDEDDEEDDDDEDDEGQPQNYGAAGGHQYSMNSGYQGVINQSYSANMSMSHQQMRPPTSHNFRANDSVEMPARSSYSHQPGTNYGGGGAPLRNM